MKRKRTPKPARGSSNVVRVGVYTIVQCDNGKIWLQKRGGEGMETSEAMFAAVIARFFKKEF